MKIMVKIKGMRKKLVTVMLTAMMVAATSTTAFAYVDESAEAEQTETVEETESVIEETQINTEDAFSVPGNAEVQDDITNSSSKEFLTITTKNNNTFYLIIDRSATTDNVYMLSQIDENDLTEFLDEEETTATVVDATPSVVLDETTDDDVQTETEAPAEEKSGSNMGALLGILVVAVLGVGAYGYMKFIKPKKDEEDAEDEGIEMVDETDPADGDEESEDFEE
jgi:flagellar basal body-associated protein FliL